MHCRELRYSAKRVEGGGSLCSTCYRKDPISFQHCIDCGRLERLHHFGLCERCSCPGVLGKLLSGPDGAMRTELEPLYQALLANDPKNLLRWLGSRGPRKILATLATGTGPITHATLDQLPNQKAAHPLRGPSPPQGRLIRATSNLLDWNERSRAPSTASPTSRTDAP